MVTVPVPKGTDVSIDVPGLHNNRTYRYYLLSSKSECLFKLTPEFNLAKYWDDPLTFKPDRFMKPDWNRDAFLPFSGGPRACLGRRCVECFLCISFQSSDNNLKTGLPKPKVWWSFRCLYRSIRLQWKKSLDLRMKVSRWGRKDCSSLLACWHWRAWFLLRLHVSH